MSAEELKRKIARSQETVFLLTLRTDEYNPLIAAIEKTFYRNPLLAIKDRFDIGGHTLDQKPFDLANTLGNIRSDALSDDPDRQKLALRRTRYRDLSTLRQDAEELATSLKQSITEKKWHTFFDIY